jgi:hypothetical protein
MLSGPRLFGVLCPATPVLGVFLLSAGGCTPIAQIAPVVASASPSGSVIERVARAAGLASGPGTTSAAPTPSVEIKVTYEMKAYGDIDEEKLPAFDPRAVCSAPHEASTHRETRAETGALYE